MRANIPIDGLSSGELLEDWAWLLKEPFTIVAMNNFGDLFLQAKDGKITLLDITWGKLETVAPSPSDFQRLASDPEKRRQWFHTDLLTLLELAGLALRDGHCFSFKKPPTLGGSVDSSNVELAPITVQVSLMGQIHRQLKDLPPGTKISGFSAS